MQRLNKAFLQKKLEIKQRANLAKVKLAQTIAFNLIMATPIDTSKALSNWIASLNNPKSKVIKAHFVGIDGSTHDQSSLMAYLIANEIVQRAKICQSIYITNSVDYIDLLNQGYSNQAPVHFIEKAVNKSVNQLKGMKI